MNNSELEKLYTKLGKAYYEGGFEDPLPELLPLFDQITRVKKEMENQMRAAVCPRCGTKIEEGDFFCGSCGQKLR